MSKDLEFTIHTLLDILHQSSSTRTPLFRLFFTNLKDQVAIPPSILSFLPSLLELHDPYVNLEVVIGFRNIRVWSDEFFYRLHWAFNNPSTDLANALVETLMERDEWPSQIKLDLLKLSQRSDLTEENRVRLEARLLGEKKYFWAPARWKCEAALNHIKRLMK